MPSFRHNSSGALFVDRLQDTAVLVSETDGVDDTYLYYIDMESYNRLSLQFVLNGGSGTVTVSVQGTIQNDGTTSDLCTYEDITNDAFGVSSWTASSLALDDTGFFGSFKYIKITVIASTGASDDADWTIYYKKN